MRALIVYESMFGNTEVIAKAIADGIGPEVGAEVVNVDEAPDELSGFDLLVIGGPTHVHGMTRPSTRKSAADQAAGADVRSAHGIREWLGALKPAPHGLRAAVFDTRLDKPRWLVGSAALGAAKLLRRKHIRVVGGPRSFYVTAAAPPDLTDGQQAAARDWGATLARELAKPARQSK